MRDHTHDPTERDGESIKWRRPGTMRLPVVALGMSLGSFITFTYVLCVLFDLWLPDQAMHSVWVPLLPGFEWISWSSFALGFVEFFAYGWYVALVFGPMFNFFSARWGG